MRVGDGSVRDNHVFTDTSVDKLSKKNHARTEASQHTEPGPKPEPDSPFARILKGLGHEVDRGESIVGRAMNASAGGKDLGNLELLALQAGVYRYSEAVDLSAKLVDRAASGVKTVLQGQ